MRVRALPALLVGFVALTACNAPSSAATKTRITVLGAASLTNVFPRIAARFSRAHPGVTFSFSFAGTEQIAAQIKQGVPADVFAGASTKYGGQLASAKLIEPYRVFCTNRLVLVTPASNPGGIASLRDLATKPVKLVIGSESVPVGAYTRAVLTNLDSTYGSDYSTRVLANVVSNEDSATSILTKVESGEADAGFVYITDALSGGTKVKTIKLPVGAQAVASYPVAVVSSSKHASVARQFVDYLLGPSAQQQLEQAGFGPPPGS